MQNIAELIKSIKLIGERKCEECGSTVPIYERDNKKVSHCLNCDNQRIKHDMEQFAKDREKKAINRLIEKYEVLPYPKPVTFNDYQPQTEMQRQAKEIVMSFSTLEETTLFFQSKPGRGKTHLSYCLAIEFKKQGKDVLFVDMPSLMSTLRSSYNYKSDFSQEELMRLIKDVDLFVLDDVGAEYAKSDDGMESWVTDVLYQIVNSRQEKMNIYTTNYSGKELQKKYGAMSGRIVSRMMSNSRVIKLDGDDHRLKGLN